MTAPTPHPERGRITVTPPTYDTPIIREWLENESRKQGYVELSWEEHIDIHGKPMGVLFGRKLER